MWVKMLMGLVLMYHLIQTVATKLCCDILRVNTGAGPNLLGPLLKEHLTTTSSFYDSTRTVDRISINILYSAT
ncbi:uncharacterized protein BCR38DRAFT_420648 [Pseudomassariella vexata]|uniref:Secreted protein n=1 Tax=Pseudomassariella vexata TaxID=1141098 RepID=A0A1Y2EFE7_9PEZI|nr:uncharacterized protein BCR38DRAFT_420648 [Pseudomassariella vexata]ORY69986.1 hypothetical protein BCR38DRAFT_420648 [Pseudomassariella vexata]